MNKLALTLPGNYNLQPPTGIPGGGFSPTGQNILVAFVSLLLLIAAVLAIIFLLLGGIRWITSAGDPKGVEAARKQITYAIIGLIVAFLGFIIVNIVGDFLGFNVFG
mgnify:CR=1 FL=1